MAEHVFYSWAAQRTFEPTVVASGEGAWFWDADGNRYLDCISNSSTSTSATSTPGWWPADRFYTG